MDSHLLSITIFTVISYLIGAIMGYQIGKTKIKPCQKCKADDLETQKLLKDQQDLSKGF